MTPMANSGPLRRLLLVDATTTGAMAALFLIMASPLESLLGLPASLLRGVGVVLIPFAGFLVWLAPRASELRGTVRSIVVGNVLWVVASLVLLVSGRVALTTLGTLFVILQAAVVAVFAYLEHRAVMRDDTPHVTAGAVTGR